MWYKICVLIKKLCSCKYIMFVFRIHRKCSNSTVISELSGCKAYSLTWLHRKSTSIGKHTNSSDQNIIDGTSVVIKYKNIFLFSFTIINIFVYFSFGLVKAIGAMRAACECFIHVYLQYWYFFPKKYVGTRAMTEIQLNPPHININHRSISEFCFKMFNNAAIKVGSNMYRQFNCRVFLVFNCIISERIEFYRNVSLIFGALKFLSPHIVLVSTIYEIRFKK